MDSGVYSLGLSLHQRVTHIVENTEVCPLCMFMCMNIPVIHFTVDGHLTFVQFLAILNKAAINVFVPFLMGTN